MSAPEASRNLDERDLDALFASLENATGIVAAVSGGPDSIALLHLLARWRKRPIVVATVDHGLRPEAADEAKLVARAAKTLGLPHRLLPWSGLKPSAGLQEAAREARYALLVDLARREGASHLATAHTRDDQAETVLMRLSRGSGVSGLAGMRACVQRDGIFHVRPLLAWPKADLVALCRANGWPFVDDPSNRNERFARVRWRKLMPALAAEGFTPERLAAFAERAARADDALEQKAREALALARAQDGSLRGVFLTEPFEIALRALLAALAEASPGAPPLRLQRVEACLGELRDALKDGRALRRTIAGALVSLDRAGNLQLKPEPPRRRGR